jgi:hypothetical protein
VCALKAAHACPWRRSDAGCTMTAKAGQYFAPRVKKLS